MTNKADLDTIAKRLRTRNESIERALQAALARAGLTRAAIEKLAALAGKAGGARIEETRQRIAAEPRAAGVSWEELCRPSLASLNITNQRSLRRA